MAHFNHNNFKPTKLKLAMKISKRVLFKKVEHRSNYSRITYIYNAIFQSSKTKGLF